MLASGEWWKADVMEVLKEAVATGGNPNVSDAFTINGQPGDLYPCSQPGWYYFPINYHIYKDTIRIYTDWSLATNFRKLKHGDIFFSDEIYC